MKANARLFIVCLTVISISELAAAERLEGEAAKQRFDKMKAQGYYVPSSLPNPFTFTIIKDSPRGDFYCHRTSSAVEQGRDSSGNTPSRKLAIDTYICVSE